MSKLWIAILAGAGGIAVGLLIAKEYAQQKVAGDIHDTLNAVGLGGGTVEQLAKNLIVPQVG
jgi:hypothetical protein